MKRLLPSLFAGLLLAGQAQAQTPAAAPKPGQQPTQQQMQQAMMLQMQMMAAMFDLRPSKLGFDETVTAIAAAVEKQGWKKEQIQDLQAAAKKAGDASAKRMKVVQACPDGFNDRLAKASQGKLPAHPCRFTVTEGTDGKIYVIRMNSAMFAHGLQGNAAKLMGEIAVDEDKILKGIVEEAPKPAQR